MNRKRERPTDAMFESESLERPDRLEEFEQRLKAVRPQSVQLDLPALQQLADEGTVDAVVELATTERSRNATIVAGSWLCGVVVGVLATLVLMSRIAPDAEGNNDAARAERETPSIVVAESVDDSTTETPSELRDESSVPVNAERRKFRSPVLMLAFDPLGSIDSAYTAGRPTLQVGTHLKRTAIHSVWPIESTMELERPFMDRVEPEDSDTETKSTRDGESKPSVSRRELMREFIEKTSGAVL